MNERITTLSLKGDIGAGQEPLVK